jgi:hypothetical protein
VLELLELSDLPFEQLPEDVFFKDIWERVVCRVSSAEGVEKRERFSVIDGDEFVPIPDLLT